MYVCMYLAAINDELGWGWSVQGCQLGQSSWKRWTDAFHSTFPPALGLRPAPWTSDFMRQMCPTNQPSIQLRGVTCGVGPSGRPAVRLAIPEYWMHRWSWATICSHLFLWHRNVHARSQSWEKRLLISFCLSIGRSVRIEELGSRFLYMKFDMGIFRKSVENIQVSLKSCKNNRYFAWEAMYIFITPRSILIKMTNVSDNEL
jgi:hypothetical protein